MRLVFRTLILVDVGSYLGLPCHIHNISEVAQLAEQRKNKQRILY